MIENKAKSRGRRVLVFAHYFYPAIKAGGPPKSLLNMIGSLDGAVDFDVLCCNHEFRSNERLNISGEKQWVLTKNRRVMYQAGKISAVLRNIYYAVFGGYKKHYFNSFFDASYTIMPLIFSLVFSSK